MPIPTIRNRSKVVACTAYTPIAVMIAITGTSAQFGTARMRVKMRIIGIISEDDVINETIPSYFGLLQSASFIPDTNQMKRKLSEIKDEPIGKFINRNVITIEEEDTILHAADLLLRHKFMNLFVVDKDSRLTGIINRSRILLGVLQEVLEEKAAEEK